MAALSHKIPDRVPATPDISILIPTRLAGKNFYDDYDLPLAYIEAAEHFGMDGWMFNGTLGYKYETETEHKTEIIRDTYDFKEIRHTLCTPAGELTAVEFAPRGAPSTFTEKYVKDFKEDFKKIKFLYPHITGYDKSVYLKQKKRMGETGVVCCYIGCPGLQSYFGWMGLEGLTYALYDYPDLFEELTEIVDRYCLRQMEMAADAGVDSILTGGSGSITLQSPELFKKMSLPTIRKVTAMAREAGILSGVHSCGKEYALVEMCHNGTDLDYVNPLEKHPQGDCDLAGIKQKFGGKLALMGNLHTTDTMLGSTIKVRLEALKAIRDAGEGGGFVLSTGDQCGYNTPYENIFEIVQVAKEFGRYPLDMDYISDEIKKLEGDLSETG